MCQPAIGHPSWVTSLLLGHRVCYTTLTNGKVKVDRLSVWVINGWRVTLGAKCKLATMAKTIAELTNTNTNGTMMNGAVVSGDAVPMPGNARAVLCLCVL